MYNADRSLTDASKDELGLAAVAQTVAERLIELQPADGIVVGLQSPWGMGKSTFLNYLETVLTGAPRTIIVRFAPWLVDDRDALLHELFAELSRGLEPRERRNRQRSDLAEFHQRREIAGKLRKFSRVAERLKSIPKAPHISLLKDTVDLPGLREVASVVRFGISSVAALKPNDQTLRQLKDEIVSRLALLNYRVVVIIDDVDRLERDEAREVFRLVRAVADFPNTTYLVAFDRVPLDLDAKQGTDIARTYLDKIIQVPIFLPAPEVSDLQRLVWRMLLGEGSHRGVLGRSLRANGANSEQNEESRLNAMLAPIVRCYLNSPRRIGIVHNVLMTMWPQISDDADICDMLIYLCLLNFDRPLADWVDDYLSVRVSGRRLGRDPADSQRLRIRLDEILGTPLRHRSDRLEILRCLLPSMRPY